MPSDPLVPEHRSLPSTLHSLLTPFYLPPIALRHPPFSSDIQMTLRSVGRFCFVARPVLFSPPTTIFDSPRLDLPPMSSLPPTLVLASSLVSPLDLSRPTHSSSSSSILHSASPSPVALTTPLPSSPPTSPDSSLRFANFFEPRGSKEYSFPSEEGGGEGGSSWGSEGGLSLDVDEADPPGLRIEDRSMMDELMSVRASRAACGESLSSFHRRLSGLYVGRGEREREVLIPSRFRRDRADLVWSSFLFAFSTQRWPLRSWDSSYLLCRRSLDTIRRRGSRLLSNRSEWSLPGCSCGRTLLLRL